MFLSQKKNFYEVKKKKTEQKILVFKKIYLQVG